MNELDEAKFRYDSIEIPEELSSVVDQAIRNSKKKRIKNKNPFQYGIIAAAACICIMLTGVRTNEAFAESIGRIPVIGEIVKVLTIRSYEYEDEDKKVSVNLPAINSDNEISVKTNEIISKSVDAYIKEAQLNVDEYKEAYLATGGTEEEFAQHDLKISVDYEIKYQDDEKVSFVLTGVENWISVYGLKNYYNVNLKDNKEISLQDLLGDDYIAIANASILEQMQEREKANPDYQYFDDDMGGFTSISEDTKFYINKSGNTVIVFDKYEIAPGFMGMQEFEIIPTAQN